MTTHINQLKIYYDTLYFEEVVNELSKSLNSQLDIPHEIIYILESEDEKKNWENTLYICFGMHSWIDMRNIPPYFIIIQLEPICIRGMNEKYLIIMKKAMAIFEYSSFNINILKEHGISYKKIYPFRVGFSEETLKKIYADSESRIIKKSDSSNKINTLTLSLITNNSELLTQKKNDSINTDSSNKQNEIYNKDIDILFIGNMTSYRQYIYNNLKTKFPSKNIIFMNSIWDEQRSEIFKRAKILLNIHTEPKKNFPLETPRLLLYSIYQFNYHFHILSQESNDINEESKWKNVTFSDNIEYHIDKILEKYSPKYIDFQKRPSNDTPSIYENYDVPTINIINNFESFIKKYIKTKIHFDFDKSIVINKHLKWFTNDLSNQIQKVDLSALPNIDTYDQSKLPCVSVITLTTPSRLIKWIQLMRWNYSHRKFPKEKIQWIIVCDKPSKENEKAIKDIQRRLNYYDHPPIWIFYDNKNTEIPIQICEKRNLAFQEAKYEYIDILDDDDIEISDALLIKIISLIQYQKKCIGSSSIICYDSNNTTLFLKKCMFPTESTLTFHKSFCKNIQPFTPSIHGEGFLTVVSNIDEIIDIPSALNLIAITHNNNVTGKSREMKNKNINQIQCSLEDFITESYESLKNFI